MGILIVSDYHSLPRQYMHWENAMDSGVDTVHKAKPYEKLNEIKKYVHLNYNKKLDKGDKLF